MQQLNSRFCDQILKLLIPRVALYPKDTTHLRLITKQSSWEILSQRLN